MIARPAGVRRHPCHARRPAPSGCGVGTVRRHTHHRLGGRQPTSPPPCFWATPAGHAPLTPHWPCWAVCLTRGVARMHERPIGDLVDACASWVARSTTWARAIRRCALRRPMACPPWRYPRHPRARRCLQPVPDCTAHGPAWWAARSGCGHRGGGRADLQALHRHHPAAAGASLASRCVTITGSASPFLRAAATSRRAASMSRPMPRLC